MPFFGPTGVAVDVYLAAFFPNRERAVIENKRFAHIDDNPKIVLARKRHQRVPAGQELCRILSLTADRRAVRSDDGLIAAQRLRQAIGDLFMPAFFNQRGGCPDMLDKEMVSPSDGQTAANVCRYVFIGDTSPV